MEAENYLHYFMAATFYFSRDKILGNKTFCCVFCLSALMLVGHQSEQTIDNGAGLLVRCSVYCSCLWSHFTLQNVIMSWLYPFLTENEQECKCCEIINYTVWWLGCSYVSTWPINFLFRQWIFHTISTIKNVRTYTPHFIALTIHNIDGPN